MSLRDPEIDYGRISTAIVFAIDRRIQQLHTSAPGIVEEYDAETKRARVQPALDMVTTDGDRLPRAPVLDVPVAWPSGGGFALLFPLAAGDAVTLLFSERGLALFKRSFERSAPEPARFYDETDAVALAGFGALSVSPASGEGASLQTEDGEDSLTVESGAVRAASRGEIAIDAEGEVSIEAGGDLNLRASGNLTLEAGNVTIRASRIDFVRA